MVAGKPTPNNTPLKTNLAAKSTFLYRVYIFKWLICTVILTFGDLKNLRCFRIAQFWKVGGKDLQKCCMAALNAMLKVQNWCPLSSKIHSYCWWKESGVHQLRLVVEISLSKGFYISHVVQDFFHQEYHCHLISFNHIDMARNWPTPWMIEYILVKISCPPGNSHHKDQYICTCSCTCKKHITYGICIYIYIYVRFIAIPCAYMSKPRAKVHKVHNSHLPSHIL